MLQCCFMCWFKFGADLVAVVTCFSHLHTHFTFLSFAISARSIIILFQIFIWTGTAQCVITVKFIFYKRILSVHPSTKTQACSINVLFSDIRTHRWEIHRKIIPDNFANSMKMMAVTWRKGLELAFRWNQLMKIFSTTISKVKNELWTVLFQCTETAWSTYLWRMKTVRHLEIITFTNFLVAFSFKWRIWNRGSCDQHNLNWIPVVPQTIFIDTLTF